MKQRKVPERMCVTCREMKQKKELLRVVRLPDGSVAVDRSGKASGRGAYICAKPECVTLAGKQRKFERSLDVADCGHIYPALMELCGDSDGG